MCVPSLSTSARLHPRPSSLSGTATSGMRTEPIESTQHAISHPYCSLSHFSAMAPAATRPMVSRAEERPPPDEARVPYLIWYVKSAWPGLVRARARVRGQG